MRASALISILALAYWTVLFVELIGDKAIYTVTTLAARYHPVEVFAGITAAFMVKTAAAVVFGRALLELPVRVTAGISAATLLLTAVRLWRNDPSSPKPAPTPRRSGVAAAFAALCFTEWADVGQLSTAALAAQYRLPLAIWIAATAALMTKGILALTLGMQLRRHVPAPVTRIAAVGCCAALGLVALGTALLR